LDNNNSLVSENKSGNDNKVLKEVPKVMLGTPNIADMANYTYAQFPNSSTYMTPSHNPMYHTAYISPGTYPRFSSVYPQMGQASPIPQMQTLNGQSYITQNPSYLYNTADIHKELNLNQHDLL